MTSLAHTLPIEVWLRVFSFACTDNGATGRSVSLVCRYLREAVRPYRFQSIHLIGGPQIAQFSRMFHQLGPEDRKIRSLVVACPKLAFIPAPPNMTTVGSMYDQTGVVVASSLMDPYVRQLTAQRTASRDFELVIIGALSQIIRDARTTLTSLSISLDFGLCLPHYDLPTLHSLVLYTPVSSSFFQLSSFPSLVQLRVGPSSMSDAEHLFRTCPNVRELHVHESTAMLLKRLRRALEIFPHLRSVTVEMEDPIRWTGQYHQEMAHIIREHLSRQLKKLTEEDCRVHLIRGSDRETWMNSFFDVVACFGER